MSQTFLNRTESQIASSRSNAGSGEGSRFLQLFNWTRAFLVVGLLISHCSTAVILSAAPQQPVPKATEDAPKVSIPNLTKDATDLLVGDFNKNWQVFNSDPAAVPKVVWLIDSSTPETDRVLICSGEPKGFLFTTATFTDFELTLEWMYPKDANGNSGVLIHTQNEPRIWPTSIQVQLHQPKAGSIFPSGDATTDSTLDADLNLARPVAMWNECRIVSRAGNISVEVNGKKAGEISGAKPATGHIALQSEGSVVQFRKIRIRELKVEGKPVVSGAELSGVPTLLTKPLEISVLAQ